MSPDESTQKADIKSIMKKFEGKLFNGVVRVVKNREYGYDQPVYPSGYKWRYKREIQEGEQGWIQIRSKQKVSTKKNVDVDEVVEAVEAVEEKKTMEKAKAPKREKKTKEDVWVTFKKKIVNGDDIDECIEMVKNELAATAVKAVTVKAVKGKRKPSSYNNFVSKTMMDMKKDETLSAKDRLSTAAKMWKALSEDEKKEFKANDTEDDASDSQM